MNDLITALRQKRAESDSTSSTMSHMNYKEGSDSMTMKDYWELMKKMDQKLDRILTHISSEPEEQGDSNGNGTSDPGKY